MASAARPASSKGVCFGSVQNDTVRKFRTVAVRWERGEEAGRALPVNLDFSLRALAE
jgi:hypothetical protein